MFQKTKQRHFRNWMFPSLGEILGRHMLIDFIRKIYWQKLDNLC